MIHIEDIMTTNPHTVPSYCSLTEAISLCESHSIRHLPVVDAHQQLIGIVSQRTLLAAQESSVAKLSETQREDIEQSILLKDIMVSQLHTVGPKASVYEAAKHLEMHKIGCLPVLENDKLVGIITDSDFVGVAITLMEMLADQEPKFFEIHDA